MSHFKVISSYLSELCLQDFFQGIISIIHGMDKWVTRWMDTMYILPSTYADLQRRYYLAKTLIYTFYTNICLCEDVQCLVMI